MLNGSYYYTPNRTLTFSDGSGRKTADFALRLAGAIASYKDAKIKAERAQKAQDDYKEFLDKYLNRGKESVWDKSPFEQTVTATETVSTDEEQPSIAYLSALKLLNDKQDEDKKNYGILSLLGG